MKSRFDSWKKSNFPVCVANFGGCALRGTRFRLKIAPTFFNGEWLVYNKYALFILLSWCTQLLLAKLMIRPTTPTPTSKTTPPLWRTSMASKATKSYATQLPYTASFPESPRMVRFLLQRVETAHQQIQKILLSPPRRWMLGLWGGGKSYTKMVKILVGFK